MAAVLAQMRGDAVGARRDRNECGAHRIGIAARPRVTKGGDVIDIDSKTQRRTCNHDRLSANIAADDVLILRSGLSAASRRMRDSVVSWFETRARERAPHHEGELFTH